MNSFGPYIVVKKLGEGGGGACHLVRDTRGDPSLLALKTLSLKGAKPALVKAFQKECEIIKKLNHPHLARIFDYGEESESLYYTSEYVEGTDIVQAAKGRDWNVIFSLVVQGCWALHDLHRSGIIHRDLKPGNVLVGKVHTPGASDTQDRLVLKIIDFGLAWDPKKSGDSQTPAGTLSYLAPEIIGGKAFDHRADLYAWGVILYSLAWGRLPFADEKKFSLYLEKLRNHAIELSPLKESGEIPEGIIQVIEALAQRDPDKRPSDIQKAIEILNEVEGEEFPMILPKTDESPWLLVQKKRKATITQVIKGDSTPQILEDFLDLIRSGKREAAWQFAQAHYEIFSQDNNLTRVEQFLGGAIHVLIEQGKYEEAKDWLKKMESHPLLREKPSLEHHLLKTQLAFREGKYRDAQELWEGIDQTLFARAPLALRTRLVNYGALIAQAQHRYGDAARYFEEAAGLAKESGRKDHEVSLLANAAYLYYEQGHWKKAYEIFIATQALAREANSVSILATVLNNLGNLYLYFGRPRDAQKVLTQSLSLALEQEIKPLAVYNLYLLTLGEEARGNWERVEEYLQRAFSYADELGESVPLLQAGLGRGHYFLWRSDLKNCEKALEELRRHAKSVGQEDYLRQADWLEAKLRIREKNVSSYPLKKWLEAVSQDAEARKLKNSLWQIEADLGELALLEEDPAQARKHFQQALYWIEELEEEVPEKFKKSFHRDRKKEKIRRQLEEIVEPPKEEIKKEVAKPNEPLGEFTETFQKWSHLNRRLLMHYDEDRLLEEILDMALELTNAERGFVILSQTQELKIRAARNFDQESLDRDEERFSRTIAEEVMRKGHGKVLWDVAQEESLAEVASIHELEIRSVLCVPLRSGPQTSGLIYLDNRYQSAQFEKEQLPFLEALADQASLALEHARLHAQAAGQINQLEKSQELIEKINTQLERDLDATQWDLQTAKENLRRQSEREGLRYRYENIIGESESLQKVLALVDRLAGAHVNVFIHGESGTGKELIARAIHYNSPRKDGAFISENCAAFAENLLESELFGHVRGAFTGAEKDKLGLFHLAHGGTLFLDEIGEMPLSMQSKLLRVLQEGEVRQVGGKHYRKVDVRVVSASNRDLKKMVDEGTFRQDLFYRLNGMQINLPPLRERVGDIPLLAENFLAKAAKTENLDPPKLNRDALKALVKYPWPGNIRELQNEMNRLVVMGLKRVAPDALSPTILEGAPSKKPSLGTGGLDKLLAAVEKEAIQSAMLKHGGNKLRVAQSLKIARCTLYDKIKKYKLVDTV